MVECKDVLLLEFKCFPLILRHSDEYAAANVCFSLLALEVKEHWRGMNIKA